MNELVKEYYAEQLEMLEKRDVKALLEFVDKWYEKGVLTRNFVKSFKNGAYEVQLSTLCKMICNTPKVSEETRKWAKNKLKHLGHSENIK